MSLRDLVATFRATTLRSASGAGLVSSGALEEARDVARRARFDRFELAHVGRYERSNEAVPERLLQELSEIVSACAGTPLAPRAHRWLRLHAGDYALAADDERFTAPLGAELLDLVLDLSDVATGEAEVVFTHRGQAFFTVPQRPGELGIVERTPTVGRYDRYLTHRVGTRVVFRLRVSFAPRVDRSPSRRR